jgi:hypothetical protein
MLPSPLLQEEIQEYINQNIGTNIAKLALQKNPFPAIPWGSIINQIAAKTKAKEKLPTWFQEANILYPSKISMEQTSSEKTALYKLEIVAGNSIIDLTGGFGVDNFYFSKVINQVIHCELDPELSAIVNHNFKILEAQNINCIAGDSHETIKNLNQKYDWIYLDPSRRSDTKGKVFLLQDCLPNVVENQSFYFSFANNILIKTAPLLDLTAGLTALSNVKKIHIIAVNNEVKELLWEIEKNYWGQITIKTINFNKDTDQIFAFILNQEIQNKEYALPKTYLYEPNAAILKSGGFEVIAEAYHLDKLHQHSHLYTSQTLIDFPGRAFKIEHHFEYNKQEMKQHLQHTKANITTRNFPDTVQEIRKRWNVKEGGERYSFFTTDANNHKIVLICTKIE